MSTSSLRTHLVPLLLIASFLVGGTRATAAQDEPPTDAAAPAGHASPRAVIDAFIRAMADVEAGDADRLDDAVACLDLGDLNALLVEETGGELAVGLKEVMDKLQVVYIDVIPDDWWEQDTYVWDDSLDAGSVTVARTADGSWLFSRATVAVIPAMVEEVAERARIVGSEASDDVLRRVAPARWLRKQIEAGGATQAWLLEGEVLGVVPYQWIGLGVLAFGGVLIDFALVFLLTVIVRWVLGHKKLKVEAATLTRALRPFGLSIMALVWSLGLPYLGLPEGVAVPLKVVFEFTIAATFVWGTYRLVDILHEALTGWAAKTDNRLDDLMVPLISKSLKVLVLVVGAVVLAHELRFDVRGLLTGLGLGGLAFALAAQDLVKNLFGSFMIIADRTFEVGDWVVIGDVEGTVERVGFRSTRIRTFYNSLISVPNSQLITTSVDNLGKRTFRRYKTKLSLTYGTPPERIAAFCEGVRELVRRHPYTRKDYYQVYLNDFADASLDVLLYVFFRAPDWSTELRERERLMLDILRLARHLGVEFAFPTQTLHLQRVPTDEPVPESWAPIETVSESALAGRSAARSLVRDFELDGAAPPPVVISSDTARDGGEAGEG